MEKRRLACRIVLQAAMTMEDRLQPAQACVNAALKLSNAG